MEHLGRYELLGELGRGGMGVVFRAHDPVIGRPVAIKTFHRHLADESMRERFQREAQAAGRLAHHNLLQVFDYGVQDDVAYIVMPLIEGGSLTELLRTGSCKHVLNDILPQVAAGLDYAHNNGIVHRDMKPSNVMVRTDGTAMVMDFGIAKFIEKSELTSPGTIVGTLDYMAPEQFAGKEVDGKSDQFALGCIAYLTLTGSVLFDSGTFQGKMHQLMEGSVRPASERNPSLPPEVDEVFDKVLARDPERRFSTCADFIKSLIRACDSKPDWSCPDVVMNLPSSPPHTRASTPPPAQGARQITQMLESATPPPAQGAGEFTQLSQRASPPPASPRPAPVPPPQMPGAVASPPPPLQMPRAAAPPPPPPPPARPSSTIVSRLARVDAPSGFADTRLFSQTGFFVGEKARFDKIEETFRFYRDRLTRQYELLERQAHITYVLWVCCVAFGFAIVLLSVVMLLVAGLAKGAATASATILVYFIQRIFQQREDHYRRAADVKDEHLKYGNQWLLAIQTIAAIEDPDIRRKSQAKLSEVLTTKLLDSPKRQAKAKAKTKGAAAGQS